jgi:hypothetical protein
MRYGQAHVEGADTRKLHRRDAESAENHPKNSAFAAPPREAASFPPVPLLLTPTDS